MNQTKYYNQNVNHQNAWLIISLLLNLAFIIFFEFLSTSLIFCSLAFIFFSFNSIKFLRTINENINDALDPGILFIIFIIMTIIPISVSNVLGLDVIPSNWSVADDNIFGKVILLNVILIIAFSSTYTIFSRLQNNIYGGLKSNYSPLLINKIWIYLYIFFFILHTLILYLNGALYTRLEGGSGDIVRAMSTGQSFGFQQFFSRLSSLTSILEIIAFGSIVCRAKNLFNARILLFIISGSLFLYSFIIFGSRGAATIILPVAVYADIIKWNGKLLEWRILLPLIILGWSFFHIADILESYYFTGSFDFWYLKLFTALEPRMVENPGLIISWVENKEEPLRYGSTYLEALQSLIPSQLQFVKTEPLSSWLIAKITGGLSVSEAGFGVAFGAVAEGYLNGKAIGVAFHGMILAFIALFIRYFKVNKKLKLIGPIFYSSFILLSYKFYRTDFGALIKRIEWVFIIVFLILLLVGLLISLKRSLTSVNMINN